MQTYLAVPVGILFSCLTLGMTAQVASGNVAESPHPRADLLQAQNPHIHRTVEGCISRVGNDYTLTAKHIGVIRLQADNGKLLGQHAGERVKVRGILTPTMVHDTDEEEETVAVAGNASREMTVERIKVVSISCTIL